MGERDWMHDTDTSSTAGSKLATRLSTTEWLSGPKFVKLVVIVVVVCIAAVLAAALL